MSSEALHSRAPLPDGDAAADNADVDVWLAFYREIDDDRHLEALRGYLSAEEQARQARYHFADDRLRDLVTRAMVRLVLSRYAPVEPADWSFSSNAYGRPEIAVDHEAVRGLTFNVSHTAGLIALAVTRGRAIGVDVEHARARSVSTGIAEHFFAPMEVTALSRLPEERQQERFFEYWTFKEAYIKARGMGLSIPLDRFAISFPGEDAVRLQVDPDLGDHAGRWSLSQYRPTAEHILAVCTECPSGRAPRFRLRQTVPGRESRDLTLSTRRHSSPAGS